MKFRFTTRGLFLLTTVVAALTACGLFIGKSLVLALVATYLLLYVGLSVLIYLYVYRRDLRKARVAWNEIVVARSQWKQEIPRPFESSVQDLDDPSGNSL